MLSSIKHELVSGCSKQNAKKELFLFNLIISSLFLERVEEIVVKDLLIINCFI